MNCTRCNKELKDFRTKITLNISSERQATTWEKLPNLTLTTNEILCKSCLDAFIQKMEEL